MHSKTSEQNIDPIMLQAIDWMIILDSGQTTEQERQAFQKWLLQDEKHQAAWQQLNFKTSLPFQQIQQQTADTQLPTQLITQTILNKKTKHKTSHYGGALCLLLVSSLVIWMQQSRPWSFWQADYYTQTAQQKNVRLEDGSTLKLNAYTAIRVDYTAHMRTVKLLQGSIIANVQPDTSRPFVVQTQHANMQAGETRFMVQQYANYSDVAVLQHTVKASNLKQIHTVQQGQVVRLDAQHLYQLTENAQTVSSWQDGVLEIHNASLSDVIEQIRPYYKGYIYLSPSAAQIKIYGVFYLNDIDKIFQTLQLTQPVKIKKIGSVLTYIDIKK